MTDDGQGAGAGRAGGRGSPGRAGLRGRLVSLVLAAGCFGVLGLAAWLEPASAGHGTHEGLGLPPCRWAQIFDKPCMTCGMTTSFAHAANGDLLRSFLTQPFGFVLAVVTAATGWGAGLATLTGSTIGRAAKRLLSTRVLWAGVGLLLVAWAYKFVTWEG